jgi:anaerobic selenocysteine-containing dehydrogenase
VRGDDDHPVSRGYTCSKGRGLAAWHHSPSRLDRPRLAGVDTTWDTLLADLRDRLATITSRDGPDAIALYLATGLAYDAAGQIAASTWLPMIGSHSFFTAATVDNAPVLVAAELVTGEPMLNPVWDPAGARCTVFVGTNPVISHGYGTALADPVRALRAARERGRVWVLDPRRTETANHADAYVPVRPGSDVAVLGALANELLANGADEDELREHCDAREVAALRDALAPFTIERAAAVADVDGAQLHELVDDIRAARGRVAMQCGTGVTMARDGVIAEWLRWVILIASGSLDRPGGMVFHRGVIQSFGQARTRRRRPGPASRPELSRVAGQLPSVALADEIEAGNIHALFLTGGNPLTAFPQPDRLRAAFAQLDVLAVVDVAENECTALATHVLPATGQLERADVTLAEPTARYGGVQFTRPVVAPVADRRPVWWMFAALSGTPPPAERSDEDYLGGILKHSTVGTEAIVAAGPRGVRVDAEPGWVRAEFLVDGRWHIAPAPLLERLAAYVDPEPARFVLAPRREMPWSNSVAYGATDAGPIVRVAPEAEGAITLTTAHGSLTTSALGDPAVRAGVVSITHGHPEANPGVLTSEHADVDPLTAMPRVSGLEVEVRDT